MMEDVSTVGGSATSRGDWAPDLVDLYCRRYIDQVRLAYLITGSRAAAEEITQDSFVALHSAWDTVERPEAYLRQVVANRCRSWFRRRDVEDRHQPAPPEPNLLEPDELWDVLQRLPYRQRAAIVLRFYADVPDDEIAEALGCARATVRTSIHRGLKALRKEIEP